MLTLSHKLQGIEESQTLVLSAKAKKLKDAGVDIANLTTGEPDFATPAHIKEAAIQAIQQNFTKYTPNVGASDLCDAILDKFARDNGLHFEKEQIVVSSGAKQAIYNVLQAICNKGDEVVLFSPYWVSYPEMVKMADARPVIVPTSIQHHFKPDLRKLRQAIHARTKAIILNSPCNPTGSVLTRSELEEIADIVRQSNIYVISDEIYEKVMYDDNKAFSIGSIKAIRDQVITVNGVSKAFAMTGWRIGYAGGPHAVMEAAAKVQGQVTSGANTVSQKAAVAALRGSMDDVGMMVAEFKRRRDFVHEQLAAIPELGITKPGGAFYFFFDVSRYYGRSYRGTLIKNSADMATYFLEHHHVAGVPGFAFGDDRCLRISYACSMSELEKGIARISKGLKDLS